MFIIKHKKIFIGISVFLVAASLALLATFGMTIGIDFKGGALTEIEYQTAPNQEAIYDSLNTLDIGSVIVQSTGEKSFIIKTEALSDKQHQELLKVLSVGGTYAPTELSFNSIGPAVGKELARKAVISIILVALTIICFIAFAFRKVSKPVSAWKYGIIAIITLLHDVIIPSGIFALLSRFRAAELDSLFVVAVLTILGLSLSDTIVIFDRVRENLHKNEEEKTRLPFSDIVGRSLEQSFVRSLATSLTVLLVLIVIFFVGPVSTRYFALMLAAGMFFGMYSSLFLASPLLVLAEEHKSRK